MIILFETLWLSSGIIVVALMMYTQMNSLARRFLRGLEEKDSGGSWRCASRSGGAKGSILLTLTILMIFSFYIKWPVLLFVTMSYYNCQSIACVVLLYPAYE